MKKKLISIILMVFIANTFSESYSQGKKILNVRSKQADSIHVVGHAHMDMNWLWTYSETMQMCNDNLRQAVAFMKEYPDYTMIQSQAAVYNFVEMVDPPLMENIKQYVREGRLELAGGMWTEGDMNLSSGEAITRSFLLGQRYFLSRFGKMTNIGWLPDNFGHVSQMPQILKLAGCDYFYIHRCKPYVGTFWWLGPDSSKVLCYANDTYNGTITNELRNEVDKYSPDKRRILHITGVGDHGGGPTRENIELIHKLDKTPGYPSVKFTTAEKFFSRAAGEMGGRPTHKGEMQFIFEGCYTTVSEIKEGNRNSENALFAGEFFNTLRWLSGDKYPAEEFTDLWKTVTFNQFHDILPGSAIYEANREAVARYTETLRRTTELKNNAFRKMADEVKFQQNKGQPVVAYNLQPFLRKSLVEATVYSHEEPFTINVVTWGSDYYGKKFTPVDKSRTEIRSGGKDENFLAADYREKQLSSDGNLATAIVRDASGKSYPAQITWAKSTPPGYTSKVQFIVDSMPAGGYKAFYIDMTGSGEFKDPVPFRNNTFETDFFRIKIDPETGCITSLFDKRTSKEFVREGSQLNNLRMYLEDRKGGMKSWTINKIVRQEDISNVESVKLTEAGPVRACIETVKTWGKSRFIGRTYIYRSYPRIDFDLEVHWLETGSDSTDSPMLRTVFPLNMPGSKFYSHVPFDVAERPVDGMINGKAAPPHLRHQDAYGIQAEIEDGQEVPAHQWVDVTDGKTGIALLNKTKYGHSFARGDLRLTLMRSAGDPDIYPNLGKFSISYSLYPHEGDWKNGVWEEGDNFNIPVFAAEPPSLALVREHATRPEEHSFISIDTPGIILSGFKPSEDGNELIIRLVEIYGRAGTADIKLPLNISLARRLNIVELPLENAVEPVVDGRYVRVKMSANEIVTLGLTVSE